MAVDGHDVENRCSSCCLSCLSSSPVVDGAAATPFSLNNLLAAGTVFLPTPNSEDVQKDRELRCTHTHAEDGWHALVDGLLPSSLAMEIRFLVVHDYIRATYRCVNDGVLLRIYVVPFDLPHVKGRLRVRKDNIASPARGYLRTLLSQVNTDSHCWEGTRTPTALQHTKSFLGSTNDTRTLADIYGNLASPQPIPAEGLGGIAHRLLDYEDDLLGLGMRSTLHKYQRRSIAAMLQRELNVDPIPNSLFIAILGVDGKKFYLQPGDMEILQEMPMMASARGGILCEELGTGKTVMILGLIMATRHQLSSPETCFGIQSTILTPVAYRHFPSEELSLEREKASMPVPQRHVPSFVELLLHKRRTDPYDDIPSKKTFFAYGRQLCRADETDALPIGRLIRATNPFYLQNSDNSTLGRMRDGQRSRGVAHARVMYLTSATLVVVPPNLLTQWSQEITKHCEDSLRVLVLRPGAAMPPPQRLASEFDIILMTYTRFTAEAGSGKSLKKVKCKPCKCPLIAPSRIPDCNCGSSEISPLLQVRWKRLVIDEGHVSATSTTLLVPFVKALSIERRWIITGTPTSNLLGLDFGSHTTLVEEDPDAMEVDGEPGSPVRESPASTPPSSGEIQIPTAEPAVVVPDGVAVGRIWTKTDREDLKKLGHMVGHFVGISQFEHDRAKTTQFVDPLLCPKGPQPGSIQVLTQVMEMVMIRHRILDVEEEVVLPPVLQETVMLDLDPFSLKSYNALQAAIVVNAVDSERSDQDYLFHPKNAEHLQDTVKNMSQILFWSVDDKLYNAMDLVSDADAYMRRALERKRPGEDIVALRAALQHLRLAVEDPLWRSMQFHEDVPYRVYNLPDSTYQAWTRTAGRDPSLLDPSHAGFLHADRLISLRELVLNKPLMDISRITEVGQTVALRDTAFRKLYDEKERKKSKKNCHGRRSGGSGSGSSGDTWAEDRSSSSQLAMVFAKKASAMETLVAMQKELDAVMSLQEEEANLGEGAPIITDGGGGPTLTAKSQAAISQLNSLMGRTSSVLLGKSPLAVTMVGRSASTKLNYILQEVKRYAANEKMLIFSDSALTLAHVAEGLDIIGVKYLRFTTQVSPRFREQLVLTFETSEMYRVFLMDLKHGARGLNLVSVSRVLFCEPVWQADVESQAIKRAHRIGQTKPITVKTLAIRNTAEESMIHRRAALRRHSSHGKQPKLLDEKGIRDYIANPQFLDQPARDETFENFPLLLLPSDFNAFLETPPLVGVASGSRTPPKRPFHDEEDWVATNVDDVDISDMDGGVVYVGPSPKRQKVVAFADV